MQPGCRGIKASGREKFFGSEVAGANGWGICEGLFVSFECAIELIGRPITFGEFVPKFGIVFLERSRFAEMANGRRNVVIRKSREGLGMECGVRRGHLSATTATHGQDAQAEAG